MGDMKSALYQLDVDLGMEVGKEVRQTQGLPGADSCGTTTKDLCPSKSKDCFMKPFQSDAVVAGGSAE